MKTSCTGGIRMIHYMAMNLSRPPQIPPQVKKQYLVPPFTDVVGEIMDTMLIPTSRGILPSSELPAPRQIVQAEVAPVVQSVPQVPPPPPRPVPTSLLSLDVAPHPPRSYAREVHTNMGGGHVRLWEICQ